ELYVSPFTYVHDREESAFLLLHLLVVDTQEADVQPVVHERLAGRRLGLRDLALVVREKVVLAARVDVEGIAEVLHGHRGALDVPAGVALAPRRIPFLEVARLRAASEREVIRLPILLCDV